MSADQTLIAWGHVSLVLDSQGIITAKLPGGISISTTVEVKCNQWHSLELTVLASGTITLDVKYMITKKSNIGVAKSSHTELSIARMFPLSVTTPVRIAAGFGDAPCCFNGKIEAPEILVDGALIAKWDFAQSISSLSVKAHTGPDLLLRNAPTRGVTGCKWDATEFCWRHKPEHYAAILFHDDDIYDFEWDRDFEFVVPNDMPSGIYIMRIEAEGHYDAMPFFVCPPLGKRRADLCVLVSTFTYTIYGNHARPDFAPSWLEKISAWNAYPNNPSEYRHYGLSTYNNHTDGSGICHASHKRVLFNLRPGYLTFGEASCSGLRHFQADSHLISWLHNQDIAYDIVTDDELDRDGVAAISGYKAVLTGSHPEYHTSATLDALKDYRDNGGGLIYLGGNGFYWRIVRHSEDPTLLEIRRSEDGLRAWARLNQGNIIMPLTAVMVAFGDAMDALHKSLLELALPHREILLACPISVLTTTKTWTGFLTALMASCLAISALADMERPGLNLIGAMKSLMRARISSLLRNLMTRITALFLFQKKC